MGGGEMIQEVRLEGSTYAEPPSRFEAGTPAIAEAIGLGAACDYLSGLGMERVAAHERELGAHLYWQVGGWENAGEGRPAPPGCAGSPRCPCGCRTTDTASPTHPAPACSCGRLIVCASMVPARKRGWAVPLWPPSMLRASTPQTYPPSWTACVRAVWLAGGVGLATSTHLLSPHRLLQYLTCNTFMYLCADGRGGAVGPPVHAAGAPSPGHLQLGACITIHLQHQGGGGCVCGCPQGRHSVFHLTWACDGAQLPAGNARG